MNLFIAFSIFIIFLLNESGKTKAVALLSIREIQNKYESISFAMSRRFTIDRKSVLAIISVESAGDPKAVGSIGERGLMQMTEAALKDVNEKQSIPHNFDDMFDPIKGIEAGSAYLSLIKWQFLKDFGNEDKAIQAYNVGASTVNNNPFAGQSYLNLVNEKKESLI